VRVGETRLEFRSKVRVLDFGSSTDSLGWLANGELEVSASRGGPVITFRANPSLFQGTVAMVWFATVFAIMLGLGNASQLLRWGAGLGGVLVGGFIVFITWDGMKSFLQYKAGVLHMLRTRSELPPDRSGAA